MIGHALIIDPGASVALDFCWSSLAVFTGGFSYSLVSMPSHRHMSPEEMTEPVEPRDELLLALGRLVFEFGLLDEALHHALWIALGMSDEVRILTSGLRFPELVERFEAIFAQFRNPITGGTGVRETCLHLRKLNEDRNREVHAVWGFWADSGRPVRSVSRLKQGGIALRMETVEPSVLQSLAQRMADAADKVWEIALDYERQRSSVGDVGESSL